LAIISCYVESLHVAVLQVDGFVPLPVPVVPEVPVPASVLRTVIRIRVVNEDSSCLLHILSLQIIDDIEPIIEETLIIEVDVVDNVLARDVLIDWPPTAVGLTVEEPGVGIVEEPGEGVLDVD
jgi:hypothetical protein